MNQNIKYPLLASCGSIGSLDLKNRIIMTAMGSNFAGEDGHTTEKLEAYYEERAKGGVGLIILETSAITWPAGASMPNMLGFSKDFFFLIVLHFSFSWRITFIQALCIFHLS